ncbi:MAG TPA: ATP-binding protein [Verrucomicrobiae bacterium]|jgi:signal transduction histidine kinase|nr:ATP-binding protein [Verrucomicrobiae bacterium]
MRIRTRLTLWYAAVLAISLLLISGRAYHEIAEQMRRVHEEQSTRHALREAGEIVFRMGLPAIALGLAGGWWLTRRTLQPLAELTRAAKEIDERTLTNPLPRSGNGDELDELAAVLNSTQVRLNNSFLRVREFTLHASHELKTPLTILHGELETALRDDDLGQSERERALSQLSEVARLSKIVDGLTLLTKADAGHVKLKKEPVSLDELVREIHADAIILAEPRGIKVDLIAREKIKVIGNAHRLRQLLLNLADNAVKYNQPRGSISMELRRLNGTARFSIANTGPGIAPELLSRVFDRFFRGDPAHSAETEGCGLGLSIAQWITQAHGGTIQIESTAKLTTVVLSLPITGTEI